jgi:hypothetical protein
MGLSLLPQYVQHLVRLKQKSLQPRKFRLEILFLKLCRQLSREAHASIVFCGRPLQLINPHFTFQRGLTVQKMLSESLKIILPTHLYNAQLFYVLIP